MSRGVVELVHESVMMFESVIRCTDHAVVENIPSPMIQLLINPIRGDMVVIFIESTWHLLMHCNDPERYP